MMITDTTPRMRGLLTKHPPTRAFLRYNPAYAGTTFIVGGELISMLIQPRVCGDYTYVVNSGRGLHDTTPRMRGLRGGMCMATMQERYNPAYAGTTKRASAESMVTAIQPRVCGDYETIDAETVATPDTTPRMRGLPCSPAFPCLSPRYNPAYAGTTRRWGRRPPTAPDTTPRMRGLPGGRHVTTCKGRYNPAYAGTTWCLSLCPPDSSIQPRVCGDYVVTP